MSLAVEDEATKGKGKSPQSFMNSPTYKYDASTAMLNRFINVINNHVKEKARFESLWKTIVTADNIPYVSRTPFSSI